MNNQISYIKTDENIIINEACISWVKQIDECLFVCVKPSGCVSLHETHKICQKFNTESFNKLNKFFIQ